MSNLSKELLENADISVEGLSKENIENMQNKEWRALNVRWTFSADRSGTETEYMTLIMRDLENREMGHLEEKKQQIEKLLKKGKTVAEIVDFCDYPVELVEEVQKSLFATQ